MDVHHNVDPSIGHNATAKVVKLHVKDRTVPLRVDQNCAKDVAAYGRDLVAAAAPDEHVDAGVA